MSDETFPASDLRWILARARERGADLFLPSETAVLDVLASLEDRVLSVWARLVRRVHPVQRRRDAGAVAEALVEAGLLTEDVSWEERAERSTVAELAAGARRLGLSAKGRRPALVARMRDQQVWSEERWVRVRHRDLVLRADRLAFLHHTPDPTKAVVERLGHVRWPTYAPEPSPPPFPDRAALERWEEVAGLVLVEEPVVAPLVQALADGSGRCWGRLDLHRRIARTLLAAARQHERDGAQAEAIALYEHVVRFAPSLEVSATLRLAFALEADDRGAEAVDALRALSREVEGPEALSIQRTGRRLARKNRTGWPPLPPLPPRRDRTLTLPDPGSHRGRPTFGGKHVEEAVIERLAEVGRVALHAEGGLWRHVYGLLLAPDAYFEPVGQLPVPYLTGPLDVGRPAFAERRPEAITHVLEAVRSGRADELVTRAHRGYAGTHLAGVTWQPLEADLALVHALGPRLIEHVLRVLLQRGWRAARGLPDLLVFPGPALRLAEASPSRLPSQLVFAELKTPNDTLSDEQR